VVVSPGQSEAVPQSGTQVPPTQKGVAPVHACPHLPQFDGLVFVSTHEPPHAVVPARQSTSHTPARHDSPARHALPHTLQLAGSDVVSVQTPLQTVRSVVHWLSKPPPSLASPVDPSDAAGEEGAAASDPGEPGAAPTASKPQAA
jgi:hypothetical protein